MEIEILKKASFSFTGKKVLQQIQDNSTPILDLIVRESIQNSLDAVKENEKNCLVKFNTGVFIASKFEELFDNRKEIVIPKNSNSNFISICDENTTGLLGTRVFEENEESNLNSLVYDFMNNNTKGNNTNLGGSWGIGKSVYYRLGIGFCIFYTRTYENNKYNDKLAIVLIEDETKNKRIINSPQNRGIAFFGELNENGAAIPITNAEEINNILEIFNEKLYQNDKTGTKIIIPFVNEESILEEFISGNTNVWWKTSLEESIQIAIQRWYFPRINNDYFPDSKLIPFINNKKLELNLFFGLLQNLYNGQIENQSKYTIGTKRPKRDFGVFKYRIFSKEELFMFSPNNFPSPIDFFGLNDEENNSNKAFIPYFRKPGMIISYDKVFSKIKCNEDEYLLGTFELNDDLDISGNSLGQYVRATEKANHKNWVDANTDFIEFNKIRPITKIWKEIESLIRDDSSDDIIVESSSNSRVKRQLSRLLMPPIGYGKKPSIVATDRVSTKKSVSSKNKLEQFQYEKHENQEIVFFTNMRLENEYSKNVIFQVKSGSTSFDIEEWQIMGFNLPYEIAAIEISHVVIGNIKITGSKKISIKELSGKELSLSKTINMKFKKDKHNKIKKIEFRNISIKNENISFKLRVFIKPIDLTYTISIEVNRENLGGIDNVSI